MIFANQRRQHLTRVLHGVEKIDDLHPVFEAIVAHVFQSGRAINEHDHLARAAHAPANGFLPQNGAKFMDRFEAGDISGRFPVAHRMALFVGAMLGKNAAQINLARLGRAVGLLAASSL